MNLELKHFRIFVVLARTLHFGQAAEKLNMAQPQLSRLITFIEQEVGHPLLVRSTRKIALTAAGEIFLEQCLATIGQVDQTLHLTRQAALGRSGNLSLAYMDFAISGPLPRILRAFRSKSESIDVKLSHMWSEQQRGALLDREIDVGFLIGPFDNPEISTLPVSRNRLMAMLPETHPLANRSVIDLRSVANEPFVFGAMSKWRPFRDIVEKICLGHGFLPRTIHEPFNSDAIFGFVAANLGITIYPERPYGMYPRGVIAKPIEDVEECIVTVAAWHKRNPSKILHNFIETVSQYAET